MKEFNEGIPDVRLQRGIAEWEAYEANFVVLAQQHVRISPNMSTGDSSRATREISEKLMCATPILRKLHANRSAYEEIQRFLADPSELLYPITVSDEAMRELRSGRANRPLTASELNYLIEGRDIPMRPYSLSLKAIQSKVARLEKQLGPGVRGAQLRMLHMLYHEYLWSQKFQADFSDADAAMLNDLVPAEEQ